MQLEELMAALEAKDTATIGQISAIKTEVAKLIDRVTNMQAHGVGNSMPPDRNKALHALGAFASKGEVAPMQELMKASSMTISSDPDGGYLVAPEIDQAIAAFQLPVSPMRRLATVIPMKSSEFRYPMNTGLPDAGWVTETAARPQTNGAKISVVSLPAREMYANPAISSNLLDDSFIDVGNFVANTIATEFTKLEGAAWTSGDSVTQPSGFLTGTIVAQNDATRSFGSLEYLATGVSGNFPASNPADVLISLAYKLSAPYRALGATWLMNSTTASVISTFKDGQGRYIWQQSLQAGMPSTLLGFPVEIDDAGMPDIGANSYSVAFGCWKLGYWIADRIGIRILRDPFTNKPFVNFFTTKRVAGGVMDSKAIKLLRFSAS